MAEPKKLKRVSKKVESETIKYLEQLLADAKSGELIGCTVIAELSGGYYRVDHAGVTSSRTQVAAMMITGALQRLGFKN